MAQPSPHNRLKPIIPAALQRGDTVGIVAPASHFSRSEFDAGIARLQKLGYKTHHLDSIFERELYFAGPAQRRTDELHAMFHDRKVKAILCVRGGYGCNHILPLIDLELIRANPKIFCGYSDLTSLMTYITDRTGLVTFHAPMVAKDYAETDADLSAPLTAGDAVVSLEADAEQPQTGSAQGVIYGGCLSMLAASLGTPYEIEAKDAIWFLEDLAAKPYQIDRMLMQLKLAGRFHNARGFVFGEMKDCTQPGGQDYSLQQVIRQVLGGLGVPIGFGIRSGHVGRQPNQTIPLNVPARLEVTADSVKLTYQRSESILF